MTGVGVLDRPAQVSTRSDLLGLPSPAADLSGGERVALAMELENSGPTLGALVIAGRCVLAGHFDMPEVGR